MGCCARRGAEREGVALILLPRSVRVYVATAPVNLRKSFEGLSNEVRSLLKADPLSGHVFLFLNRRRTQVKMLMWTRGGFTIVHKRLEQGRFTFQAAVGSQSACVEIEAHELSMLLEGLALAAQPGAKRWQPLLRDAARCLANTMPTPSSAHASP